MFLELLGRFLERIGRDQSTPIRWRRIFLAATFVGLVVWPLSAFIQNLMPDSNLTEVIVFEATTSVLLESVFLSAILALSLTRRRRLEHMLLIMVISAPIAFTVLLGLTFSGVGK